MKCHATLSFEPETYEKMKEHAKEENTTVSSLLQKIFLEYLEKEVEDR